MPHLHRFAVALIVAAVAVGLLFAPERPAARMSQTITSGGGADRDARARVGVALMRGAAAPAGAPGAAGAGRAAAVRPDRPGFDRVKAAAEARVVGANELGEVPILMFHRVLAKPQSTLDRTPAELYAELGRLAAENYVPVTAAEYVTGRMDIPAGRHPVVLTFDDGSPTHLSFDAGGNPGADTAVGVIERVAREHPGFRPVATFFVNLEPFAPGGGAAMRWLAQHGFEVANHTAHHQDLARMSRAEVTREIGADQRAITDATGVAPVTFAFPFGALAHLDWAHGGAAGGTRWAFAGMFLAGWKPALSPFEKDYDPRLIPRIRDKGKVKEDGCAQFCSVAWLDWLARNPDKRYTSDGNPATVAFPQAKMIYLAKASGDRACPY